jgi:hypothetical protein
MGAQTPVPQIVAAQERLAPVMTRLRTVSIPFPAASFLRSQGPGESSAHFSLQFSGTFEPDHGLEHLSPMDQVKTLTLTQSSLPLVRLWGGRLQLDAFQSTLHIQNVQLGPSGYGGMEGFCPSRQSYPGGPLSVHFTGLSLSFHFDRDSRAKRPTQLWRRLTRIVGTALNWTDLLRFQCHHGSKMKKKAKKESGGTTRASVEKEMAKPRMAKSAREAKINLTAVRIAPGKSPLLPVLRRAY